MATTRQLLLPFPHEPGYESADFVAAPSNQAARAWLARTQAWPDRRLAIWGGPGCGKTHLLRIWSNRVGALRCSGPSLRGLPETLPTAGLAIDDADAMADEATLLHWLNAARDAGIPVLLTGRVAPARMPVRLPDLASRLRAITAVAIDPPDEPLLRALLAHLLSDRQWRLSAEAQDRLLTLLPRTPEALREAVARLDHAMLAAGGRLTQDLVRRIAEALPGAQNEDADSTDR